MTNVIKLKRESKHAYELKKPLSLSISARHRIGVTISRLWTSLYDNTYRRLHDWYERVESTRLLGELATVAMRLNRDDFHVEIKYFGNFNLVSYFVYPGGKKNNPKGTRIIVGSDQGGKYRGNLSPKNVRKAIKVLVAMSKYSDHLSVRY